MKILFVYTHTIYGGGETYFLRIIDGIDKRRYIPLAAISARNTRLAGSLAHRGIEYVTLSDINLLWENKVAKAVVQMPNFIMLNFQLMWLIFRRNIQIVHGGMFYSALFSVIPAKILRRRFVWVALSEPDIVRYPFLTGILSLLSDRIVSVCDYFVKLADERGVYGTNKMQVIYTGLTEDRFKIYRQRESRSFNGINVSSPIVAMIARFDENQKGHTYFLEMCVIVHRKMPNVNFVIAGSPATGEEEIFKERLVEKVGAMGIRDSLFFVGHVSDMPDFFSAIDILVVPSMHEGAPVVVQEAAAAGKPVVAFPAGGVPELIENNRTGFIAPMKDYGALADFVIKLLSKPSMLRDMGVNARKFAIERFREKPFIDAYERLYDSLSFQ